MIKKLFLYVLVFFLINFLYGQEVSEKKDSLDIEKKTPKETTPSDMVKKQTVKIETLSRFNAVDSSSKNSPVTVDSADGKAIVTQTINENRIADNLMLLKLTNDKPYSKTWFGNKLDLAQDDKIKEEVKKVLVLLNKTDSDKEELSEKIKDTYELIISNEKGLKK